MTTIFSVAEKLKLWDCKYLQQIEVASNPEIVNDLFFLPSEDRKMLLKWVLKTIDPSTEWKVEEFLSVTGTCATAKEAENFVGCHQPRARQLGVWEGLSDLLQDPDLDRVEELEKIQKTNGQLIDDLAETVNFAAQVSCRLNITPYHFERELNGLKKTAPSMRKLMDLEKQGNEELEQIGVVDEMETSENILETAEKAVENVSYQGEKFDKVFRTDMEAWLPRGVLRGSGAMNRPEISQMADSLGMLSNYMSSNLQLANSNHQLSSLSSQMSNMHDKTLSTTQGDTFSLNCTSPNL